MLPLRRLWLISISISFSSLAFNGVTHEQIVRSAFQYLDTHKHYSAATDRWLASEEKLLSLLTHSVVDVDYRDNLWFGSWYRPVFAGGESGNSVGMLTSMYHFLNVTTEGVYWPYDGYAYRHTDGSGNDGYMAVIGMVVRGDLSAPLKGPHRYYTGFKGSEEDWQRLYFDDAPLSATVFPPSNIPAQLAYDEILGSERAVADQNNTQLVKLRVAHNYLFSKEVEHLADTSEIMGLPRAIVKLGIPMHMAQDLAIPQHAQGLAGHCHTELESEVDKLACQNSELCQNLYSPTAVETFLKNTPALDVKTHWNISERLISLAKISALWKFENRDCQSQLQQNNIAEKIKQQYNQAVASTVLIFEQMANDYESLHTSNGGLHCRNKLSMPEPIEVY